MSKEYGTTTTATPELGHFWTRDNPTEMDLSTCNNVANLDTQTN